MSDQRYGSLMNQIADTEKPAVPEVGMGATQLMWSDRHAYTITAVHNKRRITVQQDTATRTDTNGMSDSQSYQFAPNPDGIERVLTLRKDGKWREVGDSMNGTSYGIGYRDEYHDYSF